MLFRIDEFIDTAPEAADRVRERRDAAEHRQKVLAAAARLFAERGVNAVTMDEIARAAGVGKGTLYRRYAHKGLLCLAVMDACWRHFQVQAVNDLALNADLYAYQRRERGYTPEQIHRGLRRIVDGLRAR